MPPPYFDESIKAEKLPLEVIKWMNDAATYVRHTPGSAEEVFSTLKIALRLVAVRNPDSQSHATRKTFGLLIASIYEQPGSEKICNELLDLLIRIIDAKQAYRYNPMKHLAISGLGHLAVYMSKHMRQMAANVFIICIEAYKIAPMSPQTLWYRNTLLWTLAQSATTTVDDKSLSQAYQIAKSVIESSNSNPNFDTESKIRAFRLLTVMVKLPQAKFVSRHSSSISQLHQDHGLLSPPGNEAIADEAARFYCAYLTAVSKNIAQDIVKVSLQYEKASTANRSPKASKRAPWRVTGYARLLTYLVSSVDPADDPSFIATMEELYIPHLLILDHGLAKKLIVDILIAKKLGTDHAGVDALGILLRQLAIAQTPPSQHKSKSKESVSKPLLESTLACLGGIVKLLGNAVQPVAASVHQATLGLILNGQTALSDEQLSLIILCLRNLGSSVPTLITTTVSIGIQQLEGDKSSVLGDRRKELAYVLGAMIAESKKYPLYGDVDLNIRGLLLAVDLIKKPQDIVSYKVGWLLLQGVLCLGATIIKPITSQLLLLWEKHLDSAASTGSSLQIEYSLTGLVVFLSNNKELVTVDVATRISEILYKLWTVIESAPTVPIVRRRLLQSYKFMLDIGKLETIPSSLLFKYVSHTTNPTPYSKITGVAIESAILTPGSSAKHSAPSKSAASSADGAEGFNASSGSASVNSSSSSSSSAGSSKFDAGASLDKISLTESGMACRSPDDPRRSLSNDLDMLVFFSNADEIDAGVYPTDVSTTIVDLALEVISKILPLQPERIKESVFDALLSNLENARTCKYLRGRAVIFNIAKLMHMTLESIKTREINLNILVETRVQSIMISLIKGLLRMPYIDIRQFNVEMCANLATIMRADAPGTSTLASMVKDILDLCIVPDIHDIIRGSYILSLGYFAKQWPNLPLLEAIYKVLMPLAAHPDSNIHLPALESMRRVLTSSDMIDLKYVKCLLKTIGSTMLLDSHNNNEKFRIEIAEDLVQILSRIGPVLSSEAQVQNRSLIICLAEQLQNSSSSSVRVLASKSFIELYYYSRQGITWSLLIKRWRDIIIDPNSLDEEVDSSVNGLLMLMKLSANTIFSVAGNGLEDALWLLLDRWPRHSGVIALFYTWVDQTAVDSTSIAFWLHKLSTVVMKPRSFFTNRLRKSIAPEHDTEAHPHGEKAASVAPTAIAADEDVTLDVKSEDSSNEQFSWEARAFSIELLLRIIRLDVREKDNTERMGSVTTKNVGDIIKIAFSSATSNIIGLQYVGLALLNEVMIQYGDLADPDFPQISLLEQYQVQILSAISPAFGRDSTPSVAFVALRTCSIFLTSKIVRSKEKLNRLVRVLEGSIESMKGEGSEFKLGSVEMTSDAARMLKVAVLSVWAEIENHSAENEHLREIVSPWKSNLTSLWTEAIFDYGRLRSVLDSQWSMTSLADLVSQMKDAHIHWFMQPIYELTWVSIVEALSAVSGEDVSSDSENAQPEGISPLVLCGLCFQALIETLQTTHGGADVAVDTDRINAELFKRSGTSVTVLPTVHEYRLSILKTLRKTLTPKISELVITSTESYFEQIVPILYRVMLNGQPDEQSCVLAIARNLVEGQPETDDSVDHFFEILKIAMQPLRSLLPRVFDPNVITTQTSTLDHNQILLLQQTMDTLIDITQVFREVIQNDLWLCLLRIFEELNSHEPAVSAPSFKKLLEILAAQAEQRGITFIIGALTASLRKAVEKENVTESLLVCSALTCTNSKILLNPEALHEIQRFGERTGEVLKSVSENNVDEVEVALQCVAAVLKVCSNTPSGGSFAYGCLPGLVNLALNTADYEVMHKLRVQAVRALVLYAALDGTQETLSVVLPVLIAYTTVDEEDQTAPGLLLQLASKQPAAFKQAVWRMDPQDQKVLEEMLSRQAMEADDEDASDDEDYEAQEIELKSFV